MKIAVMHLTRMQRGFICAAGVNVEDGRQVRPVLPRGRLKETLSAVRGGPFDMATVVDLGATRAVGAAPELEDHEFTPWHARAVQTIEHVLFWDMLNCLARSSLRELFGPQLRRIGRNRAVVAAGAGVASLGCLRPTGQPSLYLKPGADGMPRPRLWVSDGTFCLDLPVTDLRLFEADHTRIRMDVFGAVARRLDDHVPLLLSVGLTRPFATREGDTLVHWLQVNNLHLEDDPAWQLVSSAQPPANPLASTVVCEAMPF